jgi:transposase InsO family protein
MRIQTLEGEHDLVDLCAALNVSRSGYHAWKQRAPGPRARANAQLWSLIEQAHEQSRATYGSPRVHRWLQRQGYRCGRHRVARLMRGHGLRSQVKRRFRVQLTDSNHDLPIAPNRLRAAALPARRDAVWVADITYVDTAEGWLYVAGVLDRHTRRCVGWAMGDSLATSLPLAALDMALTHRRPAQGLVHHSDRGVQYASDAYRQRLAAAGVVPSMSRKGNCYDNAVMESFWSSLKRELVHRCQFASRAQARAAVFEWIEIFYNRERLHSALGYQSPVDFETQLN